MQENGELVAIKKFKDSEGNGKLQIKNLFIMHVCGWVGGDERRKAGHVEKEEIAVW